MHYYLHNTMLRSLVLTNKSIFVCLVVPKPMGTTGPSFGLIIPPSARLHQDFPFGDDRNDIIELILSYYALAVGEFVRGLLHHKALALCIFEV